MAKMTFLKAADYRIQLQKLYDRSEDSIKKAVYEGAAVIIDQVRSNLQGLNTISKKEALKRYRLKETTMLTAEQKKGLLDSLGLTEIQNQKGYINTKLGFDGYNAVITKKYPKGQPNVLVARATENGSSIAKRQPFVSTGVKAKKAESEKKMADIIDQETEMIFK